MILKMLLSNEKKWVSLLSGGVPLPIVERLYQNGGKSRNCKEKQMSHYVPSKSKLRKKRASSLVLFADHSGLSESGVQANARSTVLSIKP